MNVTDKFIDIIYNIKNTQIPPSVEEKLRFCLVDYLGVTLAGAYDLKVKDDQLLSLTYDKSQTVFPIGRNQASSLIDAVFVNGLNSHFLELDDGVRYGVIHPGAPIFSALIPVAVVNNVTWEDFVLGVVSAYEVAIRVSSAVQPYHYSAGFHPTATCCTLGVAVGISMMLHFTKQEVKDAFSAATLSSYGTLKVLEDVSQLKPYNCAKAALMGFYASIMARAGFSGPSEPLLGDTGFFKMMCGQWNESVLLSDTSFFAIEKVYIKPYASCRHTHPEIEAALWMRQQDVFKIEDIDDIVVKTYKGVLGKHDIFNISGEASARMSIPYSLAVSLYAGRAGIEEFCEPYLSNDVIKSLIDKISIEGDERLSKLVPDKRGAILEVKMRNGMVLSHEVLFPKGEPENPLTYQELMDKFTSMTNHAGMNNNSSTRLFKYVVEEQAPDIKTILSYCKVLD